MPLPGRRSKSSLSNNDRRRSPPLATVNSAKSGYSGGIAANKLNGQNRLVRHLFTSNARHEKRHGDARGLFPGSMYGCQPPAIVNRLVDIVESDDGEILRNPNSPASTELQQPVGGVVTPAHDRRRT